MSGRLVRVSGPVAVAEGLHGVRLYDVVRVGDQRLLAEVIRLENDEAVLQVYEETTGLRVGTRVENTGRPLEVELGPGLLGNIFDGVQRPLPSLAREGHFLERGAEHPPLDRARTWAFRPTVETGDRVAGGDELGTVQETRALLHRVMVPPGVEGTVAEVREGELRVADPVARVGETELTMLQSWSVRLRRPAAKRLDPAEPFITGQRVIDTLYPLARGGSVTIPGGFGTGKTVQEQALARWADADVIVYIGCGERGNEMAEVLEQFPELVDPRTGASLMERTILIANTSNMPVAAREASVYTGITLAEYYRDQGYDVLLLADSTSRWGEALREVASRLDEMPAEEGYPAYLPSRLAEFYERAGAVQCAGRPERRGSVSIVGAVSPPGGDFSEPMTQYSLRLAGTFWALDTSLARRRHFPAIHWNRSYSLYRMGAWFTRSIHEDWERQRLWALQVLAEEEELQQVVQLLGPDSLAPEERVIVQVGRMIREDFLQQSAFDEVDAFCPPVKQYWMLRVLRHAHSVLPERPLEDLAAIARMREWPAEEAEANARALMEELG
ncbi:MAG: V-type ATP synthase subunit A [Planctomycetota bacterium]